MCWSSSLRKLEAKATQGGQRKYMYREPTRGEGRRRGGENVRDGREGPAGSVVHSQANGTWGHPEVLRKTEVPWNLHHVDFALSL